MRKPIVISLFSGAGGLDYGFEAAGYTTKLALEHDAYCCDTIRSNRNWNVIEGDIEKVSTQEILSASKIENRDVDIVIGGPPCQPFSKSGYWASGDAKRLSDPRANMLTEFLRVVEDIRPKAFLMENVEGIAYKGKSEGLELLYKLIRQINSRKKTNYVLHVKKLSAAEYGVPQLRERIFIVASREGKNFKFPTPTHFDPSSKGSIFLANRLQPFVTTWDVIGDLTTDTKENLSLKGKWADLLPSVPEGENYLWHTNRGGGEPLFGWRRRYWCFLLKLAKSKPSWTIQAQPGPATGPFHWNNRLLSMRELCRIQTFPDNVIIKGPRTEVQRQIGNAVPSLLAEIIARAIKFQFFEFPFEKKPLSLLTLHKSTFPPPEKFKAVPKKFLVYRGEHEEHPGTGLGFRAVKEKILA